MKKYSKVKRDAVDHYVRMIKWAEKQPKRDTVDYINMMKEIDEHWGPYYCSYCQKDNSFYACTVCELGDSPCCDGLHARLCESKTWGTWVKRAKKVLEYIRKYG